jgi:hypothetical protein
MATTLFGVVCGFVNTWLSIVQLSVPLTFHLVRGSPVSLSLKSALAPLGGPRYRSVMAPKSIYGTRVFK